MSKILKVFDDLSKPSFKHGKITDEFLKKVSFLHSDLVSPLQLKMAQHRFNARLIEDEQIWWDNLIIYFGLPTHEILEASLKQDEKYALKVPFGFLVDMLKSSNLNPSIAVPYRSDWGGGRAIIQLCHTDVDTFYTYTLAQEDNVDKGEGIFEDYSEEENGETLESLAFKLIERPEENAIQKKTLVVSEILDWKDSLRGFKVLMGTLDAFIALRDQEVTFADLEGVEGVNDQDPEEHPIAEFGLEDLYYWANAVEEVKHFFGSFDGFLENIPRFLKNDPEDYWLQDQHDVLRELYEEYQDSS